MSISRMTLDHGDARSASASSKALRAWVFALGACVLWPAASCRGLDCFDDGMLEQAYNDGKLAAEEQNRIDFDLGVDHGLALTRRDGENEGYDAGYNDGYSDGYQGPWGYPGGYDDGYAVGEGDGYQDPTACSDGSAAGAYDGDGAGYADGWDASYGDGYESGYADGYPVGQQTCPTSLGVHGASTHVRAPAPAHTSVDEDVEPEVLQACFDLGYLEVFDASAYARGLARGKLDNPDYQAGYNATYPAAYELGVAAGESDGHADGYSAGYSDGYIFGYDQVYLGCYDQAYVDGYEGAYGAGYDDGYSAGYGDGYSAGYDEGAASCG